MTTISNFLNDYFFGNKEVEKIVNHKLNNLINQISGDGAAIADNNTDKPKKIVKVSIVSDGYEGNAEVQMKQHINDLKLNPKVDKKIAKNSEKLHKFYSESSEF